MGEETDEIVDTLSEIPIMDELKVKHKRELKELEGKCTKMRHSVPRGDKKRLKEVKEEIAKMEAEVKYRHEQEMKNTQERTEKSDTTSETKNVEVVFEVVKNDGAMEEKPGAFNKPGTTRAQRRRDKKAAVAAEKVAQQKELCDPAADSQRDTELLKITAKLEALGLSIHSVAPNGDCLFSAIAHQLDSACGISSTVPALRLQAADVMRANIDDYLPFMENIADEGAFYVYCQNMETTHEWGGQLELKALSRALNMPIRVIQADGSNVDLLPGSESASFYGRPLTITFHRHEYGLGEHYNSTEPWVNTK